MRNPQLQFQTLMRVWTRYNVWLCAQATTWSSVFGQAASIQPRLDMLCQLRCEASVAKERGDQGGTCLAPLDEDLCL